MNLPEQKETLTAIIERYGPAAQMQIAKEELAECIVAISKVERGKPDAIRNLAEEIADVEIVLEQMKMIHGIHLSVDDWKIKKLEREWERMKDPNYNGK